MESLRSATLAIIGGYAAFVGMQAANAQTALVKTDTGLVSGVPGRDPAITEYKGIPYAAPPVGRLRWRAPRPATAWRGVRKADTFGNTCMQVYQSPASLRAKVAAGKSPFPAEFIALHRPMSEDCLYLNVWTPAQSTSDKLPVILWVHGGSFVSGSGDIDIYDGEGLASKGIVVVTVNYRLGVFGFFAHPALRRESQHRVSGNYGLLDQIAALRWVRRNIAAFGGEPSNVTIVGQSSGAWSVNDLVASPLTKGLFARAISMSAGGPFQPSKHAKLRPNNGVWESWNSIALLGDTEDLGVRFAATVKAHNIAELRSIPAANLLQAATRFYTDFEYLHPVVDGYVLPADLYTIYANGQQQDVPIMVGWTADELTNRTNDRGIHTVAAYRAAVGDQFGPLADDFLRAFPVASDGDVQRMQADFQRDQSFAWSTRTWGRLQAKTGTSKIYLYYWDHVPPVGLASTRFGAFHASDIVYALNNLDTWDLPWSQLDQHLANVMSSYWVNFAKTGDPNAPGLPFWPYFAVDDERSMRFGDTIAVIPTPHKRELDFFDRWYDAQRRH